MPAKKTYKQNLMALLAAFIWGTAFVAQSRSAGSIGPLLFNGSRSVIGALSLVLVLLIRSRLPEQGARKAAAGQESAGEAEGKRRGEKGLLRSEKAQLLKGSLCCGIFLTLGSVLQQWGIAYTSAGKAGFITALYVVLVPVVGFLLLKKRVGRLIWCAVALAALGLYFLCVPRTEDLVLNRGDMLVFFSAFAYTGQILCIDHFTETVDGVELSCGQFTVMMVICLLLMPFIENNTWAALVSCLPHILYVGIFSCAVAYTLQILAQKGGNPAVVSVLLCLESFFAVVSAALLLGERMDGREYLGCGLMLLAVLLSQLPDRRREGR